MLGEMEVPGGCCPAEKHGRCFWGWMGEVSWQWREQCAPCMGAAGQWEVGGLEELQAPADVGGLYLRWL